MPSETIVSVKAMFTEETSVSNSCESGLRNTLHAYTAPSATWIATPAAAINHRLRTRSDMLPPSRLGRDLPEASSSEPRAWSSRSARGSSASLADVPWPAAEREEQQLHPAPVLLRG